MTELRIEDGIDTFWKHDNQTSFIGDLFDLTKKVPQIQKYFEKMPIKYDSEKGIIQIGEEMKGQETAIEVNGNIEWTWSEFGFKVYIIPTKFLYMDSYCTIWFRK